MILFQGGDGYTIEDAIEVVGAANSLEGVAAEYRYLEQRFGKKGDDWKVEEQSLLNQNDRFFDRLVLKTKSEGEIEIYFDITSFFC